jgi:cell division protein FtsA
MASADENIEVASVGDRAPRRFSRRSLAEVVEPRYEELFSLVKAELQRSGFESLIAAGVVLTGGSAQMEGATELAEQVFQMPTRRGMPLAVSGMSEVIRNPIYSTSVGLLLFGNENRQAKLNASLAVGDKSLLTRMKSWFQGNF